MHAFVTILYSVILPIFLMIGVGFVLQQRLSFDVRTLTLLNFWVFIPALLFVQIYDTTLSAANLGIIVVHFVLLMAIMLALSWGAATLSGAADSLRRAISAATLFYNSGNYGIPVARLALPGSVAVQAIIIMLQNLTSFTLGLVLHAGAREGSNWRQSLGAALRLPMIYTFVLAWLWHGLRIPLPRPVHEALGIMGDGYVPVALLTLGAQMATLKTHRFSGAMLLTLTLRLVLGPLMGFMLVLLLGVHGFLAQALVISTSFPSAVNSALIAIEFENEPDFAAGVVFYSTLVSAVTVSIVIYAVRLWVR